MTTQIAIVSQKGGVGKTTIALNLALTLAERGWRILLVDLDPQGGIGHSLARGDTELTGLADILAGAVPVAEATRPTRLPTLTLLPRGRLHPMDVPEFELALYQGRLAEILEELRGGFDMVLLDTPSGLGLPTRAALAVADFALLPLQAESLSLRTAAQALALIEHLRATENPGLELLGILPTMAERDKEPSRDVLVALWTDFGGVLETVIPRADVFAQASAKGLPLGYLGGAPSAEAKRFELLASEVEEHMSRLKGKGGEHERPERQLL